MTIVDFGATSIQPIVELERWPFPLHGLFPTAPARLVAEHRHWLGDRLVDPATDDLILGVHSFVLRTRNRVILVDGCNGNHTERPELPPHHRLDTPYLARLAQAGLRPEDVDVVLCTHLRPDHVGWNTRLKDGRWIPTFPNATYLMTAAAFEDARALHASQPAAPVPAGRAAAFEDSVLPVVASGQALLVPDDHAVVGEPGDGVWLEAAPGHAAGQVMVHVREGVREGTAPGCRHAILCGDVIHHPIQLAEIDLPMAGDADAAAAAATRRRLVERCVDRNILVLPTHFPAPSAVRLVSQGTGVRVAWNE